MAGTPADRKDKGHIKMSVSQQLYHALGINRLCHAALLTRLCCVFLTNAMCPPILNHPSKGLTP